MSDYDFKTLNDKEFEHLCVDLLSEESGSRFERFKAGKDGGVDGRYFSPNGAVTVLQCKHYLGTPFQQFLKKLEKELPKLEVIRPDRYVLAVSYPLSHAQKAKISEVLSPHIRVDSDVLGKEDLNVLLGQYPKVEKRHYKLWLTSSTVLSGLINNAIESRSHFALDEVLQDASRYVYTLNHRRAAEVLEKRHVVIITGAPGVGKTTLGNQLCLQYVSQGYEYLQIGEHIEEAEQASRPGEKQVFYFDDFLGENYLEAITGHEGATIARFIKRISQDKDKRFILTSRSSILIKAKNTFEKLDHVNIGKSEFEVSVSELKNLDRGRILYSQMWHSGLSSDHLNEIYADRRYRLIVRHKNFNPRLISFITDPDRMGDIPPVSYWDSVVRALDSPADIWELPYNNQADDYGRSLVLLVVFNGNGIDEKSLNEAYHRYIGAPDKSNLSGKRDFYAALRLMTGAMLNRTVDDEGNRRITTFNPSIADFVLRRFENDYRVVADAASGLRSFASVHVLEGLKRNDRLKHDSINWITSFILEKIVTDNFEGVLGQSYVAALAALFYETRSQHVTTPGSALAAISFVLERPDQVYYRTLDLIHLAAELGDIKSKDVADFLTACVTMITNDLETVRYASLLKFVEDHEEREILQHTFHEHVIDRASADVDDFLDAASVFAEADEVDHENAYGLLHDAVEQRFRALGVEPDDADFASKILEDFDYYSAVDLYLNRFEAEEIEPQDDANDADGMDAVDDLFQKDDWS